MRNISEDIRVEKIACYLVYQIAKVWFIKLSEPFRKRSTKMSSVSFYYGDEKSM